MLSKDLATRGLNKCARPMSGEHFTEFFVKAKYINEFWSNIVDMIIFFFY